MNIQEFLKYITADKVKSAVHLLQVTRDITVNYDTLWLSLDPSQACHTANRLVISILQESPQRMAKRSLKLSYAFPSARECKYREFCSIIITSLGTITLSGYPLKEDYHINASNVRGVKLYTNEPNIIAFVKYVSRNFNNIILLAAFACDMEVTARELDGRGAMKLEWSDDVAAFCGD